MERQLGDLWVDTVSMRNKLKAMLPNFPADFRDELAHYCALTGRVNAFSMVLEHAANFRLVLESQDAEIVRRVLVRYWRAVTKVQPRLMELQNGLIALSNDDLKKLWKNVKAADPTRMYHKMRYNEWVNFVWLEIQYRRAMNPQEW